MKFRLLPCLLALVSVAANAQNFYIYQGSEVTVSDLRYPGKTKFVLRLFMYKAPGGSSTTVYVPQFTFDYSYDSTKLSNPEYFVMNNGTPVLSGLSSYSLSQGAYTITPGSDQDYVSTTMDNGTDVIHHNVSVSAGSSCPSGIVGASFGGSLYSYEIFRVYFDIVANNPPALSSLVYKDPDANGYVLSMGPGGSVTSPGLNILSPASPPWVVWPYTTISGSSPSWQKCNSSGSGSQSGFNSTDIGGMVRGFGLPLPIDLTYMDAWKTGSEVIVKWQTAAEVNNSHFEVERSLDAKVWTQIGTVPGHGTSASAVDYQFYDKNPFAGVNYYRLKQVDFNGQFSYCPMRTVLFGSGSQVITVYPNPSNGRLFISGIAESAEITICDALGKTVVNMHDINGGVLNIESLAKGIYCIVVEDIEGSVLRQKLVID